MNLLIVKKTLEQVKFAEKHFGLLIAPTAGRVGRLAGVSRRTAYKYCRQLAELGYLQAYGLEERGGISTAYTLLPKGEEFLESYKELF